MTIAEILDLFIKRSLKGEKFYSVIGNAVNVRADERLCDFKPLVGAKRFDVLFSALKGSDNGFVQIPKENSFIIVSFLNRDIGFVSLLSEIEQYEIKNNTESLKEILNTLMNKIKLITVATPSGVSGTPINFADFDALNIKINNLFKA